MWFLGDPKNIKISLNFKEKGPVEVDFSALPLSEQQQILLSLQQGTITSDTAFQDLLAHFRKQQEKEAPKPVAPVVQKVDEKEKELEAIKAAAQERQNQIEKKCKKMAKQSMRALQASIEKERDVKVLRSFMEVEKANKDRETILRLLETRIRECQKEVVLEIEAEKKNKPLTYIIPEATFSGDVIESDQTEITLTVEQLQALAAGKGLGGE
jgi:hypothetical protein